MKISYFLPYDEGQPCLLGTEEYTDIQQVLFPDINHFQHPITITKFFTKSGCHRWKVEHVEHPSNQDIHIFLSERKDSSNIEYLNQTLNGDKTVLSKLTKGTFVEVEFGYMPSVKKNCGTSRSNKRYPDQIQNGEMHKRRLAVVVKAEASTLQVIPVTSRPRAEGDRSAFVISEDSLVNLTDYCSTGIQSIAICNMIQTISHRRVFPPLSRNKAATKPFRNKNYPNRLTWKDMKLLNAALSSSVGLTDYQELVSKSSQLAGENHQLKSELLTSQAALDTMMETQAELMAIKKQFNGLLETMVQWRMQINQFNDKETVKMEILAEMTENAEILDILDDQS